MKKPEHLGPLLTDTAPEDVPVVFSNRGLYLWLKAIRHRAQIEVPASATFINDLFRALVDPASEPAKNSSVPFSYYVQANSQKIRRLDLVHPRNQVEWCNFYAEYGGLISHYSRRSSISLRAPVRVSATRFVPNSAQDDRKLRLLRTEVDQVGKDHLHRHPTSYFAYSGHQLLYKFFQSEQYSRMEARFPHFWKLDISNCFGSIYTHSLAWGLSTKANVKQNIGTSELTFAGRFDSVIRMANWNETNGIVVGSEFSRVFAELVLQSVDVEMERRRDQILAGPSSQFRSFRYVDDYFLFASDDITADAFVRQLGEVLSDYKMALNVAKMVRLRRPFATAQSVAIEHTRAIISDLWSQLVERHGGPEPEQEPHPAPDDEEANPLPSDSSEGDGGSTSNAVSRRSTLRPRTIRNARRLKQAFIGRLRTGAAGLDAGYAPVAGFAIQSLSSKVVRLCLDANEEPEESGRYADAIAILLDICFFIYSVEPSVRNSVRIVNACLLAVALYRNHSRAEENANLQRLIYEGCVNFAENASARSNGKPAQIEVLNLITLLGQLTPDHEVPWSLLRQWVVGSSTATVADAGYFGMIVLLHYAADRPAYAAARLEIGAAIRSHLGTFERARALESSEYCHLLLDSVVCPHLDIGARKDILNDAVNLLKVARPGGKLDVLLTWMARQTFFTDWLDVSLERSLLRKSISRVY